MKPVPLECRLENIELEAEPGRGNSITCFAAGAVDDWNIYVPSATTSERSERREAIINLADKSYLNPLLLVQVVRLCLRSQRQSI